MLPLSLCVFLCLSVSPCVSLCLPGSLYISTRYISWPGGREAYRHRRPEERYPGNDVSGCTFPVQKICYVYTDAYLHILHADVIYYAFAIIIGNVRAENSESPLGLPTISRGAKCFFMDELE